MQPVLSAKENLDAVIHVDQADAGPFFVYPVAVGKKQRRLLPGHAKAVILHGKNHASVLFPSRHRDLPAVFHAVHTVIDGIFQNRLQDQLHRAAVFDGRINVVFHRKCILIPDLLDIHVASGVLQFIPHRDHRTPFGQTDTKQFRQLRDHVGSLVVSLSLDHPDDGIQRIVEEMRIDLALQRIQLAFSPLILLHNNLFHQSVDPLIRLLDGITQMTDLQRAADIDLRLFSRLVFFYGIIELHDRA